MSTHLHKLIIVITLQHKLYCWHLQMCRSTKRLIGWKHASLTTVSGQCLSEWTPSCVCLIYTNTTHQQQQMIQIFIIIIINVSVQINQVNSLIQTCESHTNPGHISLHHSWKYKVKHSDLHYDLIKLILGWNVTCMFGWDSLWSLDDHGYSVHDLHLSKTTLISRRNRSTEQ